MRLFTVIFLIGYAGGALAQGSSGTAFAVAPGMLVTNHHVIEGCSAIEVVAADGRRAASLVSSEPSIDLALLRVFGLKGSTASLRNPRAVRLGETITVFGFPLSGALSSGGNFTTGVVSALQGLRNDANEMQITAPVQPGNSGGPVMDASGAIVGVVVSKLDAVRVLRAIGDIPQNVNFAVSLDVLAEFLGRNRVPFRDVSRSAPLDTARVAEMAQSFTYRVECRGKAQQAPPNITQPSRLPACQGSFANSTWTNCQGTHTHPSGQKYVGEFRDDKRSGQGTYTWPDGRRYEGEFKDGKRDGKGIQTLADGTRYEGEWKDDKGNGRGTYTWPDGRRYEGEWKDGKQNGQGTQTNSNGSIFHSGMWANGVPVN